MRSVAYGTVFWKSLDDIENGDFILDTARLSKRKVVSERLSHRHCYLGESLSALWTNLPKNCETIWVLLFWKISETWIATLRHSPRTLLLFLERLLVI